MFIGGVLIWAGVVALLVIALKGWVGPLGPRSAARLIAWLGVIFPATILIALLMFALWLMPGLRPEAGQGDIRIEITGRQFWWDVVYKLPDQRVIRTANEIVLPVGKRVELSLSSTDVIHSFWIPPLAGKMDMIPGRTNRLSVLATKTGLLRGPCAEYCGTSHALMAFDVSILSETDFAEWLNRHSAPSPGVGEAGGDLFQKYGCGSCHRVLGTAAGGEVGPDLSHLGSRLTLAAGILPKSPENIARFIEEPDRIKPGVQMPHFRMVPDDELLIIAHWLDGLK